MIPHLVWLIGSLVRDFDQERPSKKTADSTLQVAIFTTAAHPNARLGVQKLSTHREWFIKHCSLRLMSKGFARIDSCQNFCIGFRCTAGQPAPLRAVFTHHTSIGCSCYSAEFVELNIYADTRWLVRAAPLPSFCRSCRKISFRRVPLRRILLRVPDRAVVVNESMWLYLCDREKNVIVWVTLFDSDFMLRRWRRRTGRLHDHRSLCDIRLLTTHTHG